MKISLSTDELLAAIVACNHCIDDYCEKPLLRHIHIHAHEDGRITAEALDGYKLLRLSIEGEVIEPGDAVIHTDVLLPETDVFPPLTVSLEADKHSYTIKCDDFTITRAINPKGETYPDIEEIISRITDAEDYRSIYVSPKYLRELLSGFNDVETYTIRLDVPDDPHKAIRLYDTDALGHPRDSIYGLLMPMRVKPGPYDAP